MIAITIDRVWLRDDAAAGNPLILEGTLGGEPMEITMTCEAQDAIADIVCPGCREMEFDL